MGKTRTDIHYGEHEETKESNAKCSEIWKQLSKHQTPKNLTHKAQNNCYIPTMCVIFASLIKIPICLAHLYNLMEFIVL